MKNNVRKIYGIIVREVAKSITKLEVNSTCAFISYQPKLPEKAKKYRKF